MKKSMLIVVVGVLALTCSIGILYAQTAGPGMMDQGGGWGQGYNPQRQGGGSFSPYDGELQQGDQSRNSGRMGRGWGMDPDQRGRGWGMDPDQRDRGWGTAFDMMGRFMDMFSGGRAGRGWGRGSGGRGMGSGCR